jgi:type II secretory pathway component GspD/PulD (secretin)
MRIQPIIVLGLTLSLLHPGPAAAGESLVEERGLAAAETSVAQDDLFPAASGPLEIALDEKGEGPSNFWLARRYGELSGQHITFSAETKAQLEATLVQLDRSLSVPAAQVQQAFEVMLRQSGFSLAIESAAAPRILRIRSMNSPESAELRQTSKLVSTAQLDLARRHPAMQFHVVVELPHLDVRQVSNSLRSIITDSRTTMLLPAGNSHSMVIGGFGDWVHENVGMLQAMDAAAAQVDRVEVIIVLSSVDANAMARMLEGVFSHPESPPSQRVLIRPNEATQSLLVSAPSGRMDTIRRVIAALDR